MKKVFKTQVGRFIAGLIALILAVVVCAAVQQVPALRMDMTPQKVMTPDVQAKDALTSVSKDVTIYYLASADEKDVWVDELAASYADMNANITYQQVDTNSADAQNIISMLGGAISTNSLAIVSGDRSVILPVDEMYQVRYNQAYYYYYQQMVAESEQFIADEQLINAILYVTRDDLPVIYALTGHGESAIGSGMLGLFQDYNVRVKTLNLNSHEIPEDAAALLINAPQADLTDGETKKLLSYLKNGGKLMLMTNYLTNELYNLEIVAAYYGMNPINGVVLEGDINYSYSAEYPQFVKPITQEHTITQAVNEAGGQVFMSLSHALERNSIRRSGLNVTALEKSSDTAYLKQDIAAMTTMEQEDQDLVGPFTLAMAAEEGETRFVWYTSSTFLSDTDLTISGGANGILFKGILEWMMSVSEGVSIEGKELMTQPLQVPANMGMAITAVLFVPALIALLAGMIRRRKKAS